MKPLSSLATGKSMLGAALAGLALAPAGAEAAVYIESADFSSNLTPTDLKSTFGNFLDDHGIIGSVTVGGGDDFDYIELNVAPSTSANISFRASSNTSNFFQVQASNSSGNPLAGGTVGMPVIGTTYEGILSFVTPANGIIRLAMGQESGPGTINYSIGAVPEPTSALLGVAGLAAAALRRNRKEN